MILPRTITAWMAAAFLLAGCARGPGDSPEEAPITESSGQPSDYSLSDYIDLARSHLDSGQLTKAIEACQAGLEVDSTSKDLLNLLATAYTGEGRYALAIEALQKIVELAPGSVLTYVNLGGIYTKLGQYAEAEESLLRAYALAPAQPEVRRRLAEVYLGTNRFGEATEQIEHALRLFPEDATLYYYLGRSREGAGQDRDALDAYQKVMQLDIGFSEACYRTALLARRLGEEALSNSAMKRYQHLQQIGEGDPEVQKQQKKLRASILNAPEEAIHHLRLGKFFAEHGYLDEAINRFEKIARIAPDDVDMLNRVAGALVELQRSEEALEYYRRALRVHPDHFLALVNTGSILSVSQRHEEALVHLQRATDLVPEDPSGWYYLALGQLNAGRQQDARQSLQKGLELRPTDSLGERFRKLLISLPPEN